MRLKRLRISNSASFCRYGLDDGANTYLYGYGHITQINADDSTADTLITDYFPSSALDSIYQQRQRPLVTWCCSFPA